MNKTFTRKKQYTRLKHKKQNKTRTNTHKKTHKHKRKPNKSIRGGKPKINFPYTYFLLDYDTLRKSRLLNSYLNGQTNVCNNKSVGINTDYSPLLISNNPLFLKNNNEFCLLVLKYDDILLIRNNINVLNNYDFLNKILGHAKIIYYKSLKTIGVYNVCLHSFNITKSQPQLAFESKQTKPGYGSVLFNCIFTGILLSELSFHTIWLGIDVNNVDFDKVAWMYVSKGFRNPIYTNISPDGQILPIHFIQLTNNVYKDGSKCLKCYNSAEITTIYNEIIDLHEQIKYGYETQTLAKEGIFRFEFSFDKSAISSLRLMPFLSFSDNKNIQDIGDFHKQRETAGRFLITRSEKYKEDNVNLIRYILSLEIINNPLVHYDDNTIRFNVGEMTNVQHIDGDAVFHTHPFVNYKINNVLIGPPSGQDISTFLHSILSIFNNMQINCGDHCIENDCNVIPKLPKFGCVVSIEGLYFYSLSEQGIRNMKNAYKNGNMVNLNTIMNHYEYPFDMRRYNWESYYTDNTMPDENIVKNKVFEYLNWFKETNKTYDLFDIQFEPWNMVNNTFFRLYYYNGTILKATTHDQDNMNINIDDTKMDVEL